jgi:hypothetical protein
MAEVGDGVAPHDLRMDEVVTSPPLAGVRRTNVPVTTRQK